MVRHLQSGKYRRTRLFVFTRRLQPQVRAAAHRGVEHADLGGVFTNARFVASAGPRISSSSTTFARAPQARRLRPDAQSDLPRRPRALRRHDTALPRGTLIGRGRSSRASGTYSARR
jgi:hypothetical protein